MRIMIGFLLLLALIACGTQETTERRERPERRATLPAVATVVPAESEPTPEIEGSLPSGLSFRLKTRAAWRTVPRRQ